MRLLFVKLKHIGDALLLSPTLAAVRSAYPDAEIWVVVRKGTEGILRGCAAIDQIRTTAPPESSRRSWRDAVRGLRLLNELRSQHFDLAFELSDGDRGRLLAGLSGAQEVVGTSVNVPLNWLAYQTVTRFSDSDWTAGHRVEKDFQTVNSVLPLGAPIPPLQFTASSCSPWQPAEGLGEFAVFHPGTRWRRKRWPLDRWEALGRSLRDRGLTVVVSAGPDAEERDAAAALVAGIGVGTLSTEGRASWAQLAWLLRRARLFVGVDTAAMHLAAACGCCTAALFGPSVISQWRPWEVPSRVITPPEGTTPEASLDGIHGIRVGDVLLACDELLASPEKRIVPTPLAP